LGEVEQRHQLTDAHLAGVFAQHINELQTDWVSERLRDGGQPDRLGALYVRVNDRLAARFAWRALLLGHELQIDDHLFADID
jgi:hypothetical protein